MILAIDPGNVESGVVIVEEDTLKPVFSGKVDNVKLRWYIDSGYGYFPAINKIAIEMIASYGMSVGQTVFDTCVWIGRFKEICIKKYQEVPQFIYRKDEKMNICQSMKANDTTIKTALVDRFAPGEKNYGKGTKKEPGWFYGFKKDIWAAYAVAVTYHDMYLK